MSDTIAAIATGNVLSAIGILRLSGDGVLTVIDRVFRPANGLADHTFLLSTVSIFSPSFPIPSKILGIYSK